MSRAVDDDEGPWYQTQAYSVPGTANYDDPQNWANEMAVETTGLPKYMASICTTP